MEAFVEVSPLLGGGGNKIVCKSYDYYAVNTKAILKMGEEIPLD